MTDDIRVNITTQVNSRQIRRETLNGREHIVIPSFTLPFGVVMNGGLYPREQIEANYEKLEGTLAPLGHPTVDGEFISARSPEGINLGHIGAWNRNVRIVGNRVSHEKWIDVEFAMNSEGGRRVIERVEKIERGEGEPIHTSAALLLQRVPATSQSYGWVANIKDIDHDAILLDEPGAATPEQGVGMMVNADQAQLLQANAGALVGESYREKEQRLERAAKARFAPGADEYAWVADFNDSQAVIVRNGGTAEIYGYRTEGAAVIFDDAGTPVAQQTFWAPIVNKIKEFFQPQARPAANKEGDMPLTPEERADLVKELGAAVAANTAEQIKPLSEAVTALQANHKALSDSLTANAKAEEADKRKAVAAVHGEVVANALSGEALDAMHKSLGTAAPLGQGQIQANSGALTADVANLPKE